MADEHAVLVPVSIGGHCWKCGECVPLTLTEVGRTANLQAPKASWAGACPRCRHAMVLTQGTTTLDEVVRELERSAGATQGPGVA
jgi:hypothetical protein